MDNQKKKFLFEIEEIIVGISAILLIVSAFMTWASTSSYAQSGLVASKMAISDGMLVIFFGAVALILLFVDIKYRISAWIPMILGLLALGIGLTDFWSVHSVTKNLDGGIGAGLYVTILAALGVFVGALLDLVRNQRIRM